MSPIPLGLTQLLALTGALVGTAGLVLGILNYLRDNPRVHVSLVWDMKTNDPKYQSQAGYGMVKVANSGRRPIYISTASIALPKGYHNTHLVLAEGIQGNKLVEGEQPKAYFIEQTEMEQYAKDWRKLRAVVFDSAGRGYFSPRPHRKAKPPKWAEKAVVT
jgi:hypothetical protein